MSMISPFCKHFYNLEDKIGLTLFLKKPREMEGKNSVFSPVLLVFWALTSTLPL
jgi:hypothetical protein